MRKANAVFVNDSVCDAFLFDIHDVDVCLSGENGATACYSDEGGPVISNGQLVAVLSPRDYFCDRWRSFVAVNLSKFASWIQENIESDADVII